MSNPDFLYGLSVSFMGATGVIFPLLISPYIDRTRNIKTAVTVVNLLGLIGNLLYALPFSPALPLIGQLFAGTTPAFGVIAMGEISRCYSSEKLTKKVSGLSLVYSIGTFTSIGLVFCFLYVDFDIGEMNVNYANMPGLTLAFAFSVSTVLAFFLVSDVSKEFDMKLEDRISRSSGASSANNSKRVSSAGTPDTTMLGGGPASNRSSPATSENQHSSSSPPSQMNYRQQIPLIIEPSENRYSSGSLRMSDDGGTSPVSSSRIFPSSSPAESLQNGGNRENEECFKVIRDVGQPYYFSMSADESPSADEAETSLTTILQRSDGSFHGSASSIEEGRQQRSLYKNCGENEGIGEEEQNAQPQCNSFSFPPLSNMKQNGKRHKKKNGKTENTTMTAAAKTRKQPDIVRMNQHKKSPTKLAGKGGYHLLNTTDHDDDTTDLESAASASTTSSSSDVLERSVTKCDTVRVTIKSIWKILRHRTTAVLMMVTFMEAFVYSIIVTSLPVLAAKFLGWGKLELALLSMVNKFLSVIISGSVYFLTDYLHDFLLLCYGIGLSILALLTLAMLHLIDANQTALIGLFFAVATLSIAGVPLIITSTRSMLAKIVPTEIQSLAEAVRMSIFEASFVPAGFLVPLVTMNVSATALILLLLMGCVLVVTVRQMKILVELKEDDDYWKDVESDDLLQP